MQIHVVILLIFFIAAVNSHGFYGIEEVKVEIFENGQTKSFVGPIGFLPHSNLIYIWLCKNNEYNNFNELFDENDLSNHFLKFTLENRALILPFNKFHPDYTLTLNSQNMEVITLVEFESNSKMVITYQTKSNQNYVDMLLKHLTKYLGTHEEVHEIYGLEGMPEFLQNFCERGDESEHDDL